MRIPTGDEILEFLCLGGEFKVLQNHFLHPCLTALLQCVFPLIIVFYFGHGFIKKTRHVRARVIRSIDNIRKNARNGAYVDQILCLNEYVESNPKLHHIFPHSIESTSNRSTRYKSLESYRNARSSILPNPSTLSPPPIYSTPFWLATVFLIVCALVPIAPIIADIVDPLPNNQFHLSIVLYAVLHIITISAYGYTMLERSRTPLPTHFTSNWYLYLMSSSWLIIHIIHFIALIYEDSTQLRLLIPVGFTILTFFAANVFYMVQFYYHWAWLRKLVSLIMETGTNNIVYTLLMTLYHKNIKFKLPSSNPHVDPTNSNKPPGYHNFNLSRPRPKNTLARVSIAEHLALPYVYHRRNNPHPTTQSHELQRGVLTNKHSKNTVQLHTLLSTITETALRTKSVSQNHLTPQPLSGRLQFSTINTPCNDTIQTHELLKFIGFNVPMLYLPVDNISRELNASGSSATLPKKMEKLLKSATTTLDVPLQYPITSWLDFKKSVLYNRRDGGYSYFQPDDVFLPPPLYSTLNAVVYPAVINQYSVKDLNKANERRHWRMLQRIYHFSRRHNTLSLNAHIPPDFDTHPQGYYQTQQDDTFTLPSSIDVGTINSTGGSTSRKKKRQSRNESDQSTQMLHSSSSSSDFIYSDYYTMEDPVDPFSQENNTIMKIYEIKEHVLKTVGDTSYYDDVGVDSDEDLEKYVYISQFEDESAYIPPSSHQNIKEHNIVLPIELHKPSLFDPSYVHALNKINTQAAKETPKRRTPFLREHFRPISSPLQSPKASSKFIGRLTTSPPYHTTRSRLQLKYGIAPMLTETSSEPLRLMQWPWEQLSSAFNTVSFGWIVPLLSHGYTTTIDMKDLDIVAPYCSTQRLLAQADYSYTYLHYKQLRITQYMEEIAIICKQQQRKEKFLKQMNANTHVDVEIPDSNNASGVQESDLPPKHMKSTLDVEGFDIIAKHLQNLTKFDYVSLGDVTKIHQEYKKQQAFDRAKNVGNSNTEPSKKDPKLELLKHIETTTAIGYPPPTQFGEALEHTPGRYNTYSTRPSLYRLYWEVTGRRSIYGCILKLFGDLFSYLPPILLNLLLDFSKDPSSAPFWGGAQGAYGYIIAVLLVLTNWGEKLLLQHSYHLLIREGARARNLTMALVYRKILSMSSITRTTLGTGMLNNTITTETQRVDNIYWMGNYIFFAPVQCIVTTCLLLYYIGYSAMVGVVILTLLLPLQLSMSKFGSKLTTSNQQWTDRRIGGITEALQGIKTIKMHNWEYNFIELITHLRDYECRSLLIRQVWNGIQAMVLQAAPSLVATGTFFTYVHFFEKELTPKVAFTALPLFNLLQTTLWSMPWTVQYIMEFHVSMLRLAEFLSLPEKENASYTYEYRRVHVPEITAVKLGNDRGNDDIVAHVQYYNSEIDILDTIDLSIACSTTIAPSADGSISPAAIYTPKPSQSRPTGTYSRFFSPTAINASHGDDMNSPFIPRNISLHALNNFSGSLNDLANSSLSTQSILFGEDYLHIVKTNTSHIPIGEVRIINTDFWLTNYQSPQTTKASIIYSDKRSSDITPHTITIPLPTLHIPKLIIPQGSLTCIVGPVGSGKSFLLSCILGDIPSSPALVSHIPDLIESITIADEFVAESQLAPKIDILKRLHSLQLLQPVAKSSFINVMTNVCYVPQSAWIVSGTVRDNIIMDAPYIPQLFLETIQACALDKDIAMMPEGDLTMLAERGSTISGGQKQRISISRAVYRRHIASVFIFDSPLSALDSNVSAHIYNHVLGPNGLLKDKTRILISHQLQWTKDADQILSMQSTTLSGIVKETVLNTTTENVSISISPGTIMSRIVECGTFSELTTLTETPLEVGNACPSPHNDITLFIPRSNTLPHTTPNTPQLTSIHSFNPQSSNDPLSFPTTSELSDIHIDHFILTPPQYPTTTKLSTVQTTFQAAVETKNILLHTAMKLFPPLESFEDIKRPNVADTLSSFYRFNTTTTADTSDDGTSTTVPQKALSFYSMYQHVLQQLQDQDAKFSENSSNEQNSSKDSLSAEIVAGPINQLINNNNNIASRHTELFTSAGPCSSGTDDDGSDTNHPTLLPTLLPTPSNQQSFPQDNFFAPARYLGNLRIPSSRPSSAESDLELVPISRSSSSTEIAITLNDNNINGVSSENSRPTTPTGTSRAADMASTAQNGLQTTKNIATTETRAVGQISWGTYFYYLATMNSFLATLCVLLSLSQVAAARITDIWLTTWSSDSYHTNAMFYLKIYAILQATTLLLTFLTNVICAIAGVKSSMYLHKAMLSAILYSPLSWFDITPLGRISNRFSSDISSIDSTLPVAFFNWINLYIQLVSFCLVIIFKMWYVVFLFIPIVVIFMYISTYFRQSCRELRRLEATTRSPIFILLDQTIDGVESIHCYNQHLTYLSQLMAILDDHWRPRYLGQCLNRWLAIRLDVLGNAILLILMTVLLTVDVHNRTDDGNTSSSSLLGLIVSYALTITSKLNWLVRTSVDTENQMNSVERCNEYCKLEPEWRGDPYSVLNPQYISYSTERGKKQLIANNLTKSMEKLLTLSSKSEINTSVLQNITHLPQNQQKQYLSIDDNLLVDKNAYNRSSLLITHNHNPRIIPSYTNAKWPSCGLIEFKGVFARYRPTLPLVVKGVSINLEQQLISHNKVFSTEDNDTDGGSAHSVVDKFSDNHSSIALSGKRIAIVGRTGAGKSSLISLLLRLINSTTAVNYHHYCQDIIYDKTSFKYTPPEGEDESNGDQTYIPQSYFDTLRDAKLIKAEKLLQAWSPSSSSQVLSENLLSNTNNISDNPHPVEIDYLNQPHPSPSGILIDGVDLATLPLDYIRQNISVVPQEPVLFSQSIRFNLSPQTLINTMIQKDPTILPKDNEDNIFGEYSPIELGYTPEELTGTLPVVQNCPITNFYKKPIPVKDIPLWQVLSQVQLLSNIASLPSGLDYILKSSTDLFSLGQRQLLCLARITLKLFNYDPTLTQPIGNVFNSCESNSNTNNMTSISHPHSPQQDQLQHQYKKLLLLDECTSSVDSSTESMMNQIIRDLCTLTGCNVIAIAHHLHAILDYDLVIVMEFGEITEIGNPRQLLSSSDNQNPEKQSKFYKLVASESHL